MGNVATDAQLKSLRVQLERFTQQLKDAERVLSEDKDTVAQLNKKICGLRQRITELEESRKEVVVSEHAMLQYLQHVKKLDMREVRREILGDSAETMETFGNCTIKRDGYKVVVKNRTVVTVIATDS